MYKIAAYSLSKGNLDGSNLNCKQVVEELCRYRHFISLQTQDGLIIAGSNPCSNNLQELQSLLKNDKPKARLLISGIIKLITEVLDKLDPDRSIRIQLSDNLTSYVSGSSDASMVDISSCQKYLKSS